MYTAKVLGVRQVDGLILNEFEMCCFLFIGRIRNAGGNIENSCLGIVAAGGSFMSAVGNLVNAGAKIVAAYGNIVRYGAKIENAAGSFIAACANIKIVL